MAFTPHQGPYPLLMPTDNSYLDQDLLSLAGQAYVDYASWLWNQVCNPFAGQNYLSTLIILSLVVYGLELLFPWRRNQHKIRKDFGLDTFYMFFNFFLFGLLGFAALSEVSAAFFDDLIRYFRFKSGLENSFKDSVGSVQHLLLLFIVRDFIQWCVHRALHKSAFLWRFHKVHHSVREMGFAAHLRYHWMENVFYNIVQFIPLALLGFGLVDFFIVSVITTAIGHLNHANLRLPLGPLKYVLNNPQMHIWHHSKAIFDDHPHGVNFGLTLSCWDYIFRSAYIPSDGRDIELGFDGVEDYPRGFIGQSIDPFIKP